MVNLTLSYFAAKISVCLEADFEFACRPQRRGVAAQVPYFNLAFGSQFAG
ncbi:MAG: hypothetical protein OXP71_06280 [Candidatus Poribacteria bacterium]|nr:hypothetical protein [Candidatus Poribacteria bacterium]